jgi:hypothetical protein
VKPARLVTPVPGPPTGGTSGRCCRNGRLAAAVSKTSRLGTFLACAGVLLLAACGGSTGDQRGRTTARAGTPMHERHALGNKTPPASLENRPQAALLQLPGGRGSARYRITALSPPAHRFDVAVTAPTAAEIRVAMRTWYGVTLPILARTRGPGCTPHGGRSTCLLHFPILEAQKPGSWTVLVSKRSTPPATVRVAVTFSRPS